MVYIPPVYSRGGKWYHKHCDVEYGPFELRKDAEMAQAHHFDEYHASN